MEKVLVSACLLGAKVRYHGGDARSEHPVLRRWQQEGRLVAVCPERDGGLPTPRPPAEIVGDEGGRGVLKTIALVRTREGADVTNAFVHGAEDALAAVRAQHIRVAVLKDGSPSCGTTFTYDGTFTGARRAAPGVTAALLEQHGIRVFNESQIDAAEAAVLSIEGSEGRLEGSKEHT
ncbi:MAG: DUF523 domain-containing protein [Acidobacteria bacterium]|nr:MAG: DUF523 domain-containing protein [Acidobacteriota bacterium]